jgi:hypothetical protein
VTTYVKVLDDLGDHPRWLPVSPAGVGLWVLSLGYCSRNLTDGMFPALLLRRWGAHPEDQAVAELLSAGRWHAPGHDCPDCPEVPDGELCVHAYLDHQRSAEQVAELSAKRAEAGRRGGRARHGVASDLQEKQGVKQVAGQASSNGKQAVNKIKPDTESDTKNNTRTREAAAAVAADFESWWEMYPRKVGKGAAAKAYTKARRDVDTDTLMAGLANATQVWRATGTEPQFIPHASTWLNAGRWADEVPLPNMPDQHTAPVTLMQCRNQEPHPRHRWDDDRNHFGCQGVTA